MRLDYVFSQCIVLEAVRIWHRSSSSIESVVVLNYSSLVTDHQVVITHTLRILWMVSPCYRSSVSVRNFQSWEGIRHFIERFHWLSTEVYRQESYHQSATRPTRRCSLHVC